MYSKVLWTMAGLTLMLKPLLSRRSLLPSIRGVIETAHLLPGRLRLVVPSLVGHPDAAKNIEAQLESLDPIESVEARPASGSVVICYDPLEIEPVILFGVTARILGLEEKFDKAEQPVVWRELKAAGRAVDSAIYTKSAGFMDAKTLVSLLIMGSVGYRMIKQPVRSPSPGTITLAWWLFNLLFMRQGTP